ncbi:MAG TPA: hypothetical protein VKZ84_02115 [Bacteriovoracaceae bacterium]|nr:hypothetical protein [Bacteriovoracaceae bacterium]
MKSESKLYKKSKTLIRACHMCFKLNEATSEIEKCQHCHKSFLPLRYFDKIHAKSKENWSSHFNSIDDIDSKDLIQGLFVVW